MSAREIRLVRARLTNAARWCLLLAAVLGALAGVLLTVVQG